MRLIGLAVVLALSLFFAPPPVAEAQQPAKMYRLGYLSEGRATNPTSPLF